MGNQSERGACAWRQGCIIPANKLPIKTSKCDFYLVISHCCDIACPAKTEPFVELLPCYDIQQVDKNFSFGKNPRILHIQATLANDEHYFQLNAWEKIQIDKGECLCEGNERISEDELAKVRRWLGARYQRQVFSDSAQKALNPIQKELERKLQTISSNVLGIWVEHDEEPDGPGYFKFFIICFSPEGGIPENVETTISNLNNLNPKLAEFETRTEHDFTIHEALQYTRFYFEHISSRHGGEALDGGL